MKLLITEKQLESYWDYQQDNEFRIIYSKFKGHQLITKEELSVHPIVDFRDVGLFNLEKWTWRYYQRRVFDKGDNLLS